MEAYKNLNWEDIRLIVTTADNVLDATDKKELLAFGQQSYYSAVLEKVTLYAELEARKGVDK